MSLVYNPAKAILGTTINWLTDDIRVLLTTPDYVPDPDHEFVADITDELSGTGYVRKTVTGRTVVPDPGSNAADYKAEAPNWSNIDAGIVGHAIVFKFITNDADSQLIAQIDVEEFLTDGGDFSVEWSSDSPVGTVFRITDIGSSEAREWHDAVRTVATTNLVLSGAQTISGVAAVATDRVMLIGQTDPTENGPYIVAAGAWARAPDFDTADEAQRNRFWLVTEGDYAGYRVEHTTPEPITLGTTELTFQLVPPSASVVTEARVDANLLFDFSGGTGESAGCVFPFTPVAPGKHSVQWDTEVLFDDEANTGFARLEQFNTEAAELGRQEFQPFATPTWHHFAGHRSVYLPAGQTEFSLLYGVGIAGPEFTVRNQRISVSPIVEFVAFDPSEEFSGLIFHVDASQFASFVFAGSNVAEWKNLISNVSLAEATNRPLYEAAGFNGLPCVLGDGVDDKLVSDEAAVCAALDNSDPSVCLVAVAQALDVAQASTADIFSVYGSATTSVAELFRNTNESVAYRRGSPAIIWDGDSPGLPSSFGVDPIVVGVTKATGDSNNARVLAGMQTAEDTSNDTLGALSGVDRVALFARGTNGTVNGFFHGRIAEVRVYTSALSAVDLARLAGYLSHKWRIRP